MYRKKFIKKLGILCLFLSLCLGIGFTVQSQIFLQKQKILIQKNKERNQSYAEIPYIEIPKYQISKIIKDSVDSKILDQKYVGIWNQNKDLRKSHHIVLAGHNVKGVFGKIKDLQEGDEIVVHFKDVIFLYEVVDKKIISVKDIDYLKETPIDKITLLTCTNDDQKRQIVIGKRKHKD